MRRPRQACIIVALRGVRIAREDLLTPSNEWTGVQFWAPSQVQHLDAHLYQSRL